MALCYYCAGTARCHVCSGTGIQGDGRVCAVCGGNGKCTHCTGGGMGGGEAARTDRERELRLRFVYALCTMNGDSI